MMSVTSVAWPPLLSWKTHEFLPRLTKQRREKRVFFTTATTYIFPLEYGGSAVPSDHGPPIGLAKTHSRQECNALDYMPPRSSRVRKFNHVERMLLLQEASYTRREVARFCFETIAIQRSRRETLDDDEEEEENDNEDHEDKEPKQKRLRV
ncbi:hypothetical protein Ae201684P_021839 [Aphanomyces euteiches]|uniref:Cysteine/serine-rich nuclear protein N-terminal domain-containing protein n=1 Tax=Aphanomyces euteiches TaxID=100861 RepID=A0A6G0WSV1_9STRA|nr:hypothetical protein Ae201684_011957 [Aphanomyces euteiches]KAH9056101.1 hypothetical protein Ae201684P_021839 [Aphanomyces euteiches]